MTATTQATDQVNLTIDEVQVQVPKGTLIIRAAEQAGIQIPRFCDHPLLAPAGACRQCLVDVASPGPDGNLRAFPKPQPSCTMTVTEGMVVHTQRTSPAAEKAQKGVLELLLINHPLDCPICDKGGECPLQNQALSHGRGESRFIEAKRTFPKPLRLTPQILLDRERCVLCQRCTRFADQIAGDRFIALQQRGASQQIGRFDPATLGFTEPDADAVPAGTHDGQAEALVEWEDGEPFASYFSGNTIQICPVGALTSAAYRFRARPFDLVSTPSISEHDSNGSAIRIDYRRRVILRRLAGNDPDVNEEWITDKDRFAFRWQQSPDRLSVPLMRNAEGDLAPVSWAHAWRSAARALSRALHPAVLPGGRLTLEDAYAYSAFARAALHTNDIDFRARSHSREEASFLAARVAGTGLGVTFTDLAGAPAVLLVGYEAEEEGGVVFLRLRQAAAKGRTQVFAMAPYATRAVERMHGTWIPAVPGQEATLLADLRPDSTGELGQAATALNGGIILVGERAARVPGALSAALAAAHRLGARLAWIPRRAGERGALEAGALGNLLPGGRAVEDPAARAEIGAAWGCEIPAEPGRDLTAILHAALEGQVDALVIGGVDLDDLPDPALARRALDACPLVIALDVLPSSVTERADIVFPVAPPSEKPGTYVSWEGRMRPFGQAIISTALADARVLAGIAEQMGVGVEIAKVSAVHELLAKLGTPARRAEYLPALPDIVPAPAPGQAVLATWKRLLDGGTLQRGEPHLAATAKRPVARMSSSTALAAGISAAVRVSGPAGSITLPVQVTQMPDGVVWIPENSAGGTVSSRLGTASGTLVDIHDALAGATEGEQR